MSLAYKRRKKAIRNLCWDLSRLIPCKEPVSEADEIKRIQAEKIARFFGGAHG